MKLNENLFEDYKDEENFINYIRDNFDVSSEYIRLLYNLIPYCIEKFGFEETKDLLKETVADSIGMDEEEVDTEFVMDESLKESNTDDYYSDSDSFGYKIKQDIDDRVNDIFAEYHNMLGIDSGDISPEHSMELETKEDELSDLIGEILHSQLNYYPDETPYGESLNESDEDSDPKYDARYEVSSYYDYKYSGLEDNLYTDDFEEVKDWVWDKAQNGFCIEARNRETGDSIRLNLDNYDFESDDAYRIFDDLDSISPSFG